MTEQEQRSLPVNTPTVFATFIRERELPDGTIGAESFTLGPYTDVFVCILTGCVDAATEFPATKLVCIASFEKRGWRINGDPDDAPIYTLVHTHTRPPPRISS